jgi:hypothetical protein
MMVFFVSMVKGEYSNHEGKRHHDDFKHNILDNVDAEDWKARKK